MLCLITVPVSGDSVTLLQQYSYSCNGTSIINPCLQVLMTALGENHSLGWNFSYLFSPPRWNSFLKSGRKLCICDYVRPLKGPLGVGLRVGISYQESEIWEIRGPHLCSIWESGPRDHFTDSALEWYEVILQVKLISLIPGCWRESVHSRSRRVKEFCREP